jgi:hypothetical protein
VLLYLIYIKTLITNAGSQNKKDKRGIKAFSTIGLKLWTSTLGPKVIFNIQIS